MAVEEVRVSVIIPVYETEKWLADCLDSVICQTLSAIEIICVNDASTDGSSSVLEEYAARDPRIRVITMEENSGQGKCRNEGLRTAAGKYVYFLDSDDMIKPDAMKELFDAAEKEALDGIFFDSEVIFEGSGLERKHASYPAAREGSYPDEVMKGSDLFELFIDNGEWTCYIQRQFWKKSFLTESGIEFPVRHEHEDEVFAFCAILAAERVRYIPDKYFIRRYRDGSVMTDDPAPKNFYGYFRCLIEMDRFTAERGITSLAADRNKARIYEKLTRFYASMSGETDLSHEFRVEELDLFRFFESSQKAYLYYGSLMPGLIETAKDAEHIYIYGAGVIGKNVYEALAMEGLAVDGFVVTDAKGVPAAVKGCRITSLKDTTVPDDAIMIIAVSEGYRREIEAELAGTGWNYVYYKEKQ